MKRSVVRVIPVNSGVAVVDAVVEVVTVVVMLVTFTGAIALLEMMTFFEECLTHWINGVWSTRLPVRQNQIRLLPWSLLYVIYRQNVPVKDQIAASHQIPRHINFKYPLLFLNLQ